MLIFIQSEDNAELLVCVFFSFWRKRAGSVHLRLCEEGDLTHEETSKH